MQGLLNRFGCWRHGKGFGIHSPFAYRLVTEVLNQRNGYYAYARLGSDRRLRLLLRLVAFFRPAVVAVLSSEPGLLRRTVSLADTRVTFGTDAPDMLVADAADTTVADISHIISTGCRVALILNISRREIAALQEKLSCGMTFDNHRGTLVVTAFDHLPRQDFGVRF